MLKYTASHKKIINTIVLLNKGSKISLNVLTMLSEKLLILA